ncbi:MAG: DNA ligase, partial [Candidatus Micrarchaeia archaeon]
MNFETVAQAFAKLEETSGRLQMIDILGELFKKASKEEIAELIYLLQGQVAPPFEGIDVGMGEKFVEKAIAVATGYTLEQVESNYRKTGDLGKTAEILMQKKKQTSLFSKELSVKSVHSSFMKIAKTTGTGSQEMKIKLLAEMLNFSSPLEAKYLVRIPLGRLQLGVGDPTIIDALSVAKEGDKSMRNELERAYNLCGDLGLVASEYYKGKDNIKKFRIAPFHPIRPALAEREPTPEDIIKRLGKCAVEVKYDGFRIAIHKVGDKVQLFSRKLENTTHMFPEIVEAVKKNVKAKEI